MSFEQQASRIDVIRLRRSFRSIAIHLVLAAAVGFSGIYLSQTTTVFDAQISLEEGTLQLPLFFLLFLFLIARPIVLLFDETCEISQYHLRVSSGLFSIRRRDITIPFEEIRGVKVMQSIIERIIGYGTIVAWTHTASDPEVRLRGIKHPRQAANLLSDKIDEAQVRKKRESNQ